VRSTLSANEGQRDKVLARLEWRRSMDGEAYLVRGHPR
jgi:hypothetical protein